MKMIDAIVIWTPETDLIWITKRGTRWQRTPGDYWMPATSLGELGEVSTKGNKIKQLLAMFVLFNTIVVRDKVPVAASHQAFLEIDEYRQSISPDAPGADR